MSGRPEILFPLFGTLEGLPGVGPKTARALCALGVETPRDLLFLLPEGGVNRRLVSSLAEVELGAVATVEVEVQAHLPARGAGRPWRILVRDAAREFTIVYFQAKPELLERLFPVGSRRIVSGKVERFEHALQIVHPDLVLPPERARSLPEFEPLYPLTAGVSQRQMQRVVAAAVARAPELPEWIDPALLAREGWPSWREALRAAHAPRGPVDLATSAPARLRLAYDELFAHQLTLALVRARRRALPGRPTRGDGRLFSRVLAALPYSLTGAQRRAIAEITADMAAARRMRRLLQGDVGSGKTLVAFAALVTAVEAGGQGVLMAPTEVLARQHLLGLAPLAQAAGIRLECLTGRDKGRERAEKLADLRAGKIDVLIGTHAVFQPEVTFADLRLAVIDEQHRFGVAQRLALGEKGEAVDVLVMTATPIPRSLALAHYGDMDLSILDEKPPGRQRVLTRLVPAERTDSVIAHLARAVTGGRQAYWVCPLVEESETMPYTAAETRFRTLAQALPPGTVGLIHGQMAPAEKDAAMAAFAAGHTRVLVATTVIEVGVDVPNASIMIIEGADTFGLAQLHQLRGRVGRGAGLASCLLLYNTPLSEAAKRRLQILRDTDDGFRIAEEDLAMRGAVDMIGTAQSGLPRFRIADLERHGALLQIAQSDARALIASDPELTSPRGQAARLLLWLTGQERAVKFFSAG